MINDAIAAAESVLFGSLAWSGLAGAGLALLILSGIPLGRWACRRDPGPLRAHPANNRAACPHPDICPTCRTLADRAEEHAQ